MARQKPIGKRQYEVQLQRPPADAQRDGDGNYDKPFEQFAQLFASVEPATSARLERLTLSGFIGTATHILTVPFIDGVELQQRVNYAGRRLDIIGFSDPEENHIELILVCQEVKP